MSELESGPRCFGTTIIAVPSYFKGEKPISPAVVHIKPTANLTDVDRREEEKAWPGNITMLHPDMKFGKLKADNGLPKGYTGDWVHFDLGIIKNSLGKRATLQHDDKVKFILYEAKDGDKATLEKPKASAVYVTAGCLSTTEPEQGSPKKGKRAKSGKSKKSGTPESQYPPHVRLDSSCSSLCTNVDQRENKAGGRTGPAQVPAALGHLSLYDLMKPEVRKPHRGKDFLENLAYECSFGEDFQTYLEGLPAGTHPDKKFRNFMMMWKTSRENEVGEQEEAKMMVIGLEGISPKPNDIIGKIKSNFNLGL